MSHETSIRRILMAGDLLSTHEIARRVGISQSTVSRCLRGPLARDVQSIGAGRGSRYGLRQTIGRHGHTWPVYAIDENGARVLLGKLTSLAGDNWVIQFSAHAPSLYRREFSNGISEGWPWFLDELRPQGFMGRAFARQYHHILGAPEDLLRWTSHEYLLAALLYGQDLPGNLVIGDREPAIAETIPESHWISAAMRAVDGAPVGSSAAGERPKFTSGREIVKFANREGPGERWADLLIAECHASEVLREHGLPSVHSRIVEQNAFVFLAVDRFDRVGDVGRRAVHSMEAIDNGFFGKAGSTWVQIAERLLADELIDSGTCSDIEMLWSFGRAIGNTDMHLGNLSFFLGIENRFELAPVYDMLPMRYAPTVIGLPESLPTGIHHPIADAYWLRLLQDQRISDSFRRICELNLK